AFSDLIIADVSERIAKKVTNSAALEESESSLKAMDRILSKESMKQSSQELIPLMLEGINALDSVKTQTSCRVAQPVISADQILIKLSPLCKEMEKQSHEHWTGLPKALEENCFRGSPWVIGNRWAVVRGSMSGPMEDVPLCKLGS
ncbi:hypothetical protein P4O66_021678, partial [Electrophorus voltai]